MSLQLVTPPAGEPVSLAEAKLHLRVDVDDDDSLIGSLIAAARQSAETLTGRQMITARWKLVLDAFPCHAILLSKCPVQSVVNIQYLDMNGMSQTLPLVDYVVDESLSIF